MSSSDEVRPAARSAGPLDRIEAAEKAIELWVREQMSPLSTGESRWNARDKGRAALSALVNVAKAAEQLRRPEGRVYCRGGDETCEDCVGSCGIEEWQEFREALAALNKEPALTALQDTPADSPPPRREYGGYMGGEPWGAPADSQPETLMDWYIARHKESPEEPT